MALKFSFLSVTRASTIARLAQIIAERDVKSALRRVLLVQAKRLAWLADQRAKAFAGAPDDEEEEKEDDAD